MIFGPSQLLLQNILVHVSFSYCLSRCAEADLLVREHTQLSFPLELLNSPLEGLCPVAFPRWGFSRKMIKSSVVHYPGCLNTRTQSFFRLEHSISLRRSCLMVCMGGICIVSRCQCFHMCVCEAVSPHTYSIIFCFSLTFHLHQAFLNPESLCLHDTLGASQSVIACRIFLAGTSSHPGVTLESQWAHCLVGLCWYLLPFCIPCPHLFFSFFVFFSHLFSIGCLYL